MTAVELASYVGKTGQLNLGAGFKVPVMVTNACQAYGRLLLDVTPVGGSGVKRVNASKVRLNE